MCYFIDLSYDSAQNEKASSSIAEQVATSTMAPERSRKRLRASSDELESVLFAQADFVTAATHNEGSRPAKRERLTARKGGWPAAGNPSHQRTIQEYTAEKPGWEQKLAKCKNALARSIVQNAFMTHAPNLHIRYLRQNKVRLKLWGGPTPGSPYKKITLVPYLTFFQWADLALKDGTE